VFKIEQNHFQACGTVSVSTIARGARLGETREGKLEKGALVRVMFFGEQAMSGIVQAVDKVTATIAFGLAVGPWAVTVPRDWLQKREGSWSLEIG
jgi:hypothetical protein